MCEEHYGLQNISVFTNFYFKDEETEAERVLRE